MPADTQQILDAADKLGQMVAQHPAVEKFHHAQRSLGEDPDAARLMNDFNRQIMTLARQEEAGMPVTDQQRQQLESLQTQLASHLKIKALNIAQMEFIDLLRRVSDTIRQHVSDVPGGAGAGGGAAPGGRGNGGVPGGGPKLVI